MARALRRLRFLPPRDRARMVVLGGYRVLPRLRGRSPRVSDELAERWFGPDAPILYHAGFGRSPSGQAIPVADELGAPTSYPDDPRVIWEGERDQDLAARVSSEATWNAQSLGFLVPRLQQFLASGPPPNAMEASLRCVTWLELARFMSTAGLLRDEMAASLGARLVALGRFIEHRLHEVPLGGNHYLAHATGLLYLGRLLPGLRMTDRWARRGAAIIERELLRQFRPDGGSYEQSTGYHLFSLELALGATLLLKGQGRSWSPPAMERLRAASRFAAALVRPDGSVPILGDDDSGRLHRWGGDTRGREICALAALVLEDAVVAAAAQGASCAASWLWGAGAAAQLHELTNAAPAASAGETFPDTGLHVLRDGDSCHAVIWSRDPSAPAMLSHPHSDHNGLDVWAVGVHLLRDPGSGTYLGDVELRNRLRATEAHTTLRIDGVEISPFSSQDVFFMPPLTRGALTEWSAQDDEVVAAVRHDGFRRLGGSPVHTRTVSMRRDTQQLTVVDEVAEPGGAGRVPRMIDGWWQWGDAPAGVHSEQRDGTVRWRFDIGDSAVELCVPVGTGVEVDDPFPWSPRYGTVLIGRRTVIRYRGALPFRMDLRVRYGRPPVTSRDDRGAPHRG